MKDLSEKTIWQRPKGAGVSLGVCLLISLSSTQTRAELKDVELKAGARAPFHGILQPVNHYYEDQERLEVYDIIKGAAPPIPCEQEITSSDLFWSFTKGIVIGGLTALVLSAPK